MTHPCEKDEVVIVPFPFTDLAKAKTRPALVLSTNTANQASGQTILAMITTAQKSQWPTDVSLTDLSACGLSKPSVVRFKLFTLDNRLIARRIGCLADKDRSAVQRVLRAVLAI
jgi:mRNA interferase MazF